MQTKSPKQELHVVPHLQPQTSYKNMPSHQTKQQISQQTQPQKIQQLPYPPPKKREELKKVQDQIQFMKNKVLLLKIQLHKEQETIKINKSRTEQVIKKKINVNKIQKYKIKDHSLDLQRAEQLRVRNASLRQSHQSQMQNILKAIYLVKLDDARQIKNLSKSYRKKILETNEAAYNQQLQKKKKVAEQHQRAKQKYEKYWKEKLASIADHENKSKQEIQRAVYEKKDQLKDLRQQQIKLLERMNKIQSQHMQTKKQYLAALSLPIKDVAEALNRSKSSINEVNSLQKAQRKVNRLNSQMIKSKNTSYLNQSLSNSGNETFRQNPHNINRYQQFKIPNSSVNQQKLKIVLKQLKRLQKKQKQQIQK